MKDFNPNPPSFYAVYCGCGRRHFYSGHHTAAEVLQFHSRGDREEAIDRINTANCAWDNPVVWVVTAKEAAQYVNLRAYSLNCHEEACYSLTGLVLCHYNTCQIF